MLNPCLDINASDIANITSRLSTSNIYITQEVVFGGVVEPNEYINNGESFCAHICGTNAKIFLNQAMLWSWLLVSEATCKLLMSF